MAMKKLFFNDRVNFLYALITFLHTEVDSEMFTGTIYYWLDQRHFPLQPTSIAVFFLPLRQRHTSEGGGFHK